MILIRRCIALLAVVIALNGTAFAESTKVTFLLTNDIYSMGDTLMPDGKRRGGFARLAAVVKAERERARVSGGHVILAHGGDTLSPSLMSGIDRGEHIITLTNMVPPDIFVPGNHEFDFGKAVFLQRMADARFPRYAANLRDAAGRPLPGFKDREILTLDGVRIGVTGAAYDDTPRVSSSEDLKFAPTVPAMREQAEALRRDGADFVLAVMHAERGDALQLASAANAFHMILMGHNHDLFIAYDGHTVMAESAYDAHYVIAIDVSIEVKDEDGRRRTAWWPQFRVIDTATVTPDGEVAARVAAFEAQLDREMNVPLGVTAVELDSRNATVRSHEAAIGNLIADAMRESNDVVAAVTNGGGIRAGKLYAPGTPITRRDVLAEMPFHNKVMTLDISGADLLEALEGGLARLPAPSGRFPQVSGLRIEYDAARPEGQRITAISIGGAPLDPSKTYRIATNDFLARGSDGYATFGKARALLPEDDSPLLATQVMDHIRKLGTIRTGVEGRLVAR